MKPLMWLALIACLVGLAFQVRVIGENGDEKLVRSPNGLELAEQERPKAENQVVKSAQIRVVSERRVYFDFDKVETGPAAQRFLKAYPGMREMLLERRAFAELERTLKSRGLAGRHPDILAVREKMKPLEGKIMSHWKDYQLLRLKRRAKE